MKEMCLCIVLIVKPEQLFRLCQSQRPVVAGVDVCLGERGGEGEGAAAALGLQHDEEGERGV